ncbi:hypothetical protein C5167_042761 [Papaver somniferum]|uniref:Chromo domain-containing protein n=1 Tax=Papaver somniferum TaxID=3469 RepID=A0A4Y7L7N3_PAPSO|nr:hypothetical protein C5167_042761 [Papaver somniferum]
MFAAATKGGSDDATPEYMVKWQGLSYVEVTWERDIDIAFGQDAVDEYKAREDDRPRENGGFPVEKKQSLVGEMIQMLLRLMKWGTVKLFSLSQCWNFYRLPNKFVAHFLSSYRCQLCLTGKKCKKWLPEMNVVVYVGNRASLRGGSWYVCEQHKFYTNSKSGRIIKFHAPLTTHEVVLKDKAVLTKIKWSYLMEFSTKNKLLITGAPLQNSVEELWAFLHFPDPVKFKSKDEFSEKYKNLSSFNVLEANISDFEKCLDIVAGLQADKGTGEELIADFFDFGRHKFASPIKESDFVCPWLRTEIMLEYTSEEASAFLQKNLDNANASIVVHIADLQFLRDQLTITQVYLSLSLGCTWDVHQHRIKLSCGTLPPPPADASKLATCCLWASWYSSSATVASASTPIAQVLSQQTQALQLAFSHHNKHALSYSKSSICCVNLVRTYLSRRMPRQLNYTVSMARIYIPQGQTVPNSLSNAAAVPGSSTTAATTPASAPVGGQVALPPCNWIEHTAREGYKYYSVTSESRREKPE